MASNTAVGHQMALGDTLGDTARGQQQPMVVPWFIYSGQGVTLLLTLKIHQGARWEITGWLRRIPMLAVGGNRRHRPDSSACR